MAAALFSSTVMPQTGSVAIMAPLSLPAPTTRTIFKYLGQDYNSRYNQNFSYSALAKRRRLEAFRAVGRMVRDKEIIHDTTPAILTLGLAAALGKNYVCSSRRIRSYSFLLISPRA